MNASDIVYEEGPYWVGRAKCGFEVFRVERTLCVRCAVIGFEGDGGLQRAKREISRRLSLSQA